MEHESKDQVRSKSTESNYNFLAIRYKPLSTTCGVWEIHPLLGDAWYSIHSAAGYYGFVFSTIDQFNSVVALANSTCVINSGVVLETLHTFSTSSDFNNWKPAPKNEHI